MTRLTIPARDLQRDDRFDFCGLPAVVHFVSNTPANAPASTGISFSTEGGDGSVWVTPDTLVAVDRTDPDADLIERMAQAMTAAWEAEATTFREMAGVALAVVRAEQ